MMEEYLMIERVSLLRGREDVTEVLFQPRVLLCKSVFELPDR